MRKLLLLFALCSTVYLSVSGQVKIKEEVEVEPSKEKITPANTTATSPYSFQFNISVDNPSADTYVAMIYGNGNVSGGGEWGSTSLSVTGIQPATFLFQFRINSIEATNVDYQLYFDGDLVREGRQRMPGASQNIPYFNIEYKPPLSSDFIFYTGSENECGMTSIKILPFTSDSLTTLWHRGKDMINLSFSSSGEYASFAQYIPNAVYRILGKSIDVHYSEINTIYIISTNKETGSEPPIVTVNASVNGIEHTDNEELSGGPNGIINYWVLGLLDIDYFYGREVEYEVTLEGIDVSCPDYSNYEIPDDLTVNAEIVRGEEYVNLYDFADTLFTPQKVLIGMPSMGSIFIIADGNQTTQIDTAVLRFTTNYPDFITSEVKFAIYPPELKVEATPHAIFTDDSTHLSFLQLGLDGNFIPFPPLQLFEVYNETYEYGILYSVPFDEFSNDLYGIPDNVKFYSYPEIPQDTVYAKIIVVTEVEGGGHEGGGTGITLKGDDEDRTSILDETFTEVETKTGNLITKKKLTTVINNKQNKIKIPTYNNAIVSPKLIKLLEKINETGKDKGTKNNQTTLGTRTIIGTINVPIIRENDCQEEIVECDNFEPQKLSENGDEFISLQVNDLWQWKDADGNNKETYIEPYNCIKTQVKHPGALGLTKVNLVLRTISADYLMLIDLEVSACLDKREEDPKWRFSIDNLRIPIFSDYCRNSDFIDLEDGLNTVLLELYINSKEMYNNVIDGINYMIEGPYSQFNDYPSYFYFSEGTRAHEDQHVNQMKEQISLKINNEAFPEIKEMNLPTQAYPCPEDAVLIQSSAIKSSLRRRIFKGMEIKKLMGYELISSPSSQLLQAMVPRSELLADQAARSTYILIRTRVESWAKQQSWWNQ